MVMAEDRSVGALTKEYRAKAVGVDWAFGGVGDEITGIVLRKLKGFVEVRGWCLELLGRVAKGFICWVAECGLLSGPMLSAS